MGNKKSGDYYREISLRYALHEIKQETKNVSADKLLRKKKKKKQRPRKRPTQLGDYALMRRINQSENIYKVSKEEFANMLFRRMTTEEKLILPELTLLGFFPQKVVLGFIPDFWHPYKRVIVEIDGGYHTELKQKNADAERDAIFARNNYKVMRFTNDQVSNNLKTVVEQIKKVVLV